MMSTTQISDILRKFIDKYDFNLNDLNAPSTNSYKNLPLNLAIQMKSLDHRLSVIKELLRLGANPNSQDMWTPDSNLHAAIKQDESEIVEILCENAADVNFVGPMGLTPFETAMRVSHGIISRPRILKTLLKSGATVKYEEDGSEISIEDLEKLYLKLRELIINEYKNAGELKKKLLILIGEGHELKMSLLIEIMVLNIATQLGIRNLILEINDAMLKELAENGIVIGKRCDFLVMESIFAVAKFLGMKFFAGDPEHGISGDYADCLDNRNKTTSKYLCAEEFEGGAISIIGSDHFKGLMEDYPLAESFHVLAINTYPLLDPSKKRAYDTNITDNPFLKSPKLYQFYSCPGNPELWSEEEIRNKINIVVHQYQTKQIIHDATGLSHKESDIVLDYLSDNLLLPSFLHDRDKKLKNKTTVLSSLKPSQQLA